MSDQKPIHRMKNVNEMGDVTSLCKPRVTIDLRKASWVILDGHVTCPACLKLMRAEVARLSEELKP